MTMVDRTIRVQLVGDATSLIDAAKRAREALSGVANVNLGGVSGSMRDAGAAAEEATVSASGWMGALQTGLAVVGIQTGFDAIKNGFTTAMQQGMDYQKNMNTLQAVTGSTAIQMQLMGAKAKQLGADITIPGVSAGDAAQGMAELAKGGLSAGQAMEAARGTMLLATAAQIDGAAAAEIQVNALNAFRLSAESAGHVSDVLANSANAASGDVGDMAAALKQSATVANGFGISIDDTATALGLMAKNGVLGSDAGTSLKTALVNLSSPTKQQKAAMQELNLQVWDAQGNFVGLKGVTEQLSAAHQNLSTQAYASAAGIVFGTDAMRVANILGAEGTTGWNNMATAVGKAGGAEELAAAQTQGFVGALSAIGSTAGSLAVDIYEKLSPALAQVVNIGTSVIGWATTAFTWFTNLPAPIVAVTTAFAGLLAMQAFSGLLTGIAAIGPAIAKAAVWVVTSGMVMETVMFNLRAAAALTWMAMGGLPGVAIAAGIAVIVGAIAWFTSSNDEANASMEAAQTAVKGLGDAYQATGGKIDESVRKAMLGTIQGYKDEKQGIDGLTGYLARLNLTQRDGVDAMAGVPGAADKVEGAFRKQVAAVQAVVDSHQGLGASNTKIRNDAQQQVDALNREHDGWVAMMTAAGLAPAAAAAAADAISGGMDASGAATDAAAGKITSFTDHLAYVAPAFGDADKAAEGFTKALEDAVKNAQALVDSDGASMMLADFKDKADAAKRSGDIFSALLDKLDGRNRSYDDTLANSSKLMSDLTDAWDKGTTAATENGDAGNLNQEALRNWDVTALNATSDGQALYSSLGDMADGYADTTNAAYANGLATSSATDQTGKNADAMAAARTAGGEYRDRFIEIAAAHLGDRDAAIALADKLGIVDSTKIADKDFALVADDADAQAKLNAAQTAVIQDKKFKVFADAWEAQLQVDNLNRVIKEIDGKAVKFTAVGNVVVQLDATAAAFMNYAPGTRQELVRSGQPQMRAGGGYISGSGGPTSDSIDARLSTGEFVVNAGATGKHRGLLEAINNGTMGFAAGGKVPAGAPAGATASVSASIATPDVGAVKATWDGVAGAVQGAWTGAIDPALTAMSDGTVAVGQGQDALLSDNVLPSWSLIGSTVADTVNGGITPTFDALNAATDNVGARAIALRDGSVNPAWQGMSDQVYGVWNGFSGGVFPAYTAGMDGLGASAATLSANTSTSWGQIGATVSGTYNDQVVPAWAGVQGFANSTGSFFAGISAGTQAATLTTTDDISQIQTAIDNFFTDINGKAGATTPGKADGGLITAGTGPRSDDVHVRVSKGEYVVNAAATARHKDTLDQINYGGAFADGGQIGDATNAKVNKTIVDGTRRAVEAGVSKAMSAVTGSMGGVVIDATGVRGAFLKAVASKMGSQYEWGAAGPDTFDCSGLMSWALSAAGAGVGRLTAQDFNAGFPHVTVAVPGDMVTFDTGRLPGQAGHIGAVVDPARGLMMHTDGAGPARVSSYVGRDGGPLSIIDPIGTPYTPGGGGTGGGEPAGDWLSSILNGIKNTVVVGGPTGAGTPGGGVEQWRATVLQALALEGQAVTFADTVLYQMQTESSGNPDAINLTDSNAQRGTPSKGLMQVIDPTFATYRDPSLSSNIYDPLANIAAAIRYVLAVYGGIAQGMQGHAYDNGGVLPVGWSTSFNGTGGPEAVMNDRQWSIASSAMNHVISGGGTGGGGVVINARVFVGNREITDIARVEAEYAVDNGMNQLGSTLTRQAAQS